MAMLVSAIIGGNNGMWIGWCVALLAIPLTIGFPTTFATVFCLALCAQLPFWAFWVFSALLGLLLQTATLILVQRLTGPGRAANDARDNRSN